MRIDDVLARATDDLKGSTRSMMYRDTLLDIQRRLSAGKRLVAKSPKQPSKAPAAGFELSKDEKTLLELTNKEREKEGLRPFKASAKLFEAARKHSANMARKQELAHTLDGKGPGERLRDLGYRFWGLGENCAAGQRTPAEAIRSWLDSPGHRRNLLGGDYTEVGLGVVTGEDGTRYWTQVFATPAP
jgi:uncharacterized protein YkwD